MVPGPAAAVIQPPDPYPQQAELLRVARGLSPRTTTQPTLALGSLQDLWQHRTEGWSRPALGMLDLALAPSTWQRYHSSLLQFRNHCWQEGVSFPPEHPAAVAS